MHKYYLFALDKIEAELINHRRNVHIGDPSLPHRAGRAYAKLMRGERSKVGYGVTPSGRLISVRPLMRPTPDIELLAKALLRMAIRQAEEREDQNQAAPSDQSSRDRASDAPHEHCPTDQAPARWRA